MKSRIVNPSWSKKCRIVPKIAGLWAGLWGEKLQKKHKLFAVVRVRHAIQTQDVSFCSHFVAFRMFEQVLIDLVPKVAPIPWGFGFGLN